MKIVIPGGSGQVGTVLARAFHRDGHDVVVLSRRPRVEPWRSVEWDGQTLGSWRNEIDGCDVVINLAGRSVNCRYNAMNRAEILESRVLSTRVVGQAITQSIRAPRVWLQASTATIYAHRYDGPNDETSGLLGGREKNAPSAWNFSIDVASAWERTFNEIATDGTRKIALRSAMTMSPEPGGVFDALLGLTRHGLGGTAGDGRQFVSWIHYEDFIAAIRWLIDHDRLHAHGNGAHFEEPSSGSNQAASARFRVHVSDLARGGPRPPSAMATEARSRRARCVTTTVARANSEIRMRPRRSRFQTRSVIASVVIHRTKEMLEEAFR
jgi:uncharacterized protein (TIGR01777 family)